MKFKKHLIPAGIVVFLAAVGCTNSPKRSAAVNDEPRKSLTEMNESKAITNSAATEANAHNFVEIVFDAGSSNLTENAKSSLNSVMDQARSVGEIDEIIVLSWADEEYPSKNVKKLSKPQKDLAERRNRAVASYIKNVKSVDVDAYNMAEQPNAMQKWFNTKDSQLKNSFVAAGLPTTADDPQYPSKASHSVILVKLE